MAKYAAEFPPPKAAPKAKPMRWLKVVRADDIVVIA